MQSDFGTWLRAKRVARGLTQRQLGLPQSTVAHWESGRRHPSTVAQCLILKDSLQISLDALYAAMGWDSPEASDIESLIVREEWATAYAAIQQLQLDAYKTGNTAVIARAHDLMMHLQAAQPDAGMFHILTVDDPRQALDWGTAALRQDQWLSALGLFQAAARALPPHSEFGSRLYNNMALTEQALGHLTEAIHWDMRYIGWAAERHDAWHGVVAHALALMHKIMQDPTSDIAQHVDVLNCWTDGETGLPDPLVECWLWDGQIRQALATGKLPRARALAKKYGQHVAEKPSCHIEQLRLADIEAQLLAAAGESDRAAALLQTVLAQPEQRHQPAYVRLEVAQTWARLDGTVLVWRQLMQTYWVLGARGWMERLLPEWQQVEPGVSLDVPPFIIPA